MMDKSLCEEIINSVKPIIDHKYIKLLSESSFRGISEHLRKDKKTIGNKANFTYSRNIGSRHFTYMDIKDTSELIHTASDGVISE
jgi:hypothetical protein